MRTRWIRHFWFVDPDQEWSVKTALSDLGMVQHEVAGLDENQKSYDSADDEPTDLEESDVDEIGA
jgi:hypothetical protein